jgi:hypothetical protein
MLKRLALGLAKGLALGGAIGAALHFGLGWQTLDGALMWLFAILTGGLAAVLSGKPPWAKDGGWIEGILKGVAGLGLGALAYWLGSRFLALGVPLDLGEITAGTPWTSVPLAVLPAIGAIFGAAVELDNTPTAGKDAKDAAGAKARVAVEAEPEAVEEEAPPNRTATRRKRAS